MRHAYGSVADIFCDCPPWKVEEGGEIRKVVFLPLLDGEVREGELLGVLNFYSAGLLNPMSLRSLLAPYTD